jgi:hypothetical protein
MMLCETLEMRAMARMSSPASRHLIALCFWCAVGFVFLMRRQVSLFSYISEEKVSLEESEGPLEGL